MTAYLFRIILDVTIKAESDRYCEDCKHFYAGRCYLHDCPAEDGEACDDWEGEE